VVSEQYQTEEWLMDFIEVIMIALKRKKKKPEATECSDHRTYSKDTYKKD
jgi:hypothetical protein